MNHRKMTFAQRYELALSLLRNNPVKNCSPQYLADSLAKGEKKTWFKGDRICLKGSSSTEMFIITRGKVSVVRNDSAGIPRQLILLEPPNIIGHMGLLDKSKRSATCFAIEKTEGLRFSDTTFACFLTEDGLANHAFRQLIMGTMTHQLSLSNQQFLRLSEAVDARMK